ncbi:hypothetical protein MASR1M66_02090 [Aminivibrio sp.]
MRLERVLNLACGDTGRGSTRRNGHQGNFLSRTLSPKDGEGGGSVDIVLGSDLVIDTNLVAPREAASSPPSPR